VCPLRFIFGGDILVDSMLRVLPRPLGSRPFRFFRHARAKVSVAHLSGGRREAARHTP